jgi:hypothetical protein
MLPNKSLNRLNMLMLCKEKLLSFFSILQERSDTLFQVRYKPISHFLPSPLSLASALLVAATGRPFHLITDQENYLLINQTAIWLAICSSRCGLLHNAVSSDFNLRVSPDYLVSCNYGWFITSLFV